VKAERRWIVGVIVFAVLAVWATWKSLPRTTRIIALSYTLGWTEWGKDTLPPYDSTIDDSAAQQPEPKLPSGDEYPAALFVIPMNLQTPGLEWDKHAEFYAEWWNGLLARLGEPSLHAANRDRSIEIYRFVFERSFYQLVVVQLEILPDGSGAVVGRKWQRLPGKPSQEKRANLSKSKVAQWRTKLDQAGYWSMIGSVGGAGIDSSSWTLEGCRDGKLQLVNRHMPFPSPFADLCLDLLDYSGMSAWPVY
jgi:hypothetical protein